MTANQRRHCGMLSIHTASALGMSRNTCSKPGNYEMLYGSEILLYYLDTIYYFLRLKQLYGTVNFTSHLTIDTADLQVHGHCALQIQLCEVVDCVVFVRSSFLNSVHSCICIYILMYYAGVCNVEI